MRERPLRIMYPASMRTGGAERQMVLLAKYLPRDRFDSADDLATVPLFPGNAGSAPVMLRDVADIRALKQRPGKHIHAVGGASLVSTLMNGHLVDQLRLTVHPLVLGKGKALFKDVDGRHRLELLETRPLAGGRVSLTYDVA